MPELWAGVVKLREFRRLLDEFPADMHVRSYEDGIKLFLQDRRDDDYMERKTIWVDIDGGISERIEIFQPARLSEYGPIGT